MSGALAVRRGKVPVVVWGRGRWESRPHTVMMSDIGAITAITRCGREVMLSDTVSRICLTQLPADLFLAVSCGLCSRSLVSDLRAELIASIPDARDRLAKLLDKATWSQAGVRV